MQAGSEHLRVAHLACRLWEKHYQARTPHPKVFATSLPFLPTACTRRLNREKPQPAGASAKDSSACPCSSRGNRLDPGSALPKSSMSFEIGTQRLHAIGN